MNHRIYTLALGLIPLALTIGCEKKQTKEEIIAEYEASKIEQERIAKLEEELADLKQQQELATDKSAQAQQVRNDYQKALERQLQEARQRAEAVEKEQAEAKAREEATTASANAPPPEGTRGERTRGEGQRGEGTRATVISLARGTKFSVSLSREITTDTHGAGESWEGTLAQDVSSGDQVLWPAGTRVSGTVSQSTPTGRLASGEGALAISLTDVGGSGVNGGIYAVTVNSQGNRSAKVIAGTAALGALIGVLSDRRNQADHALGGAAIGAAVGTAVAGGTANTTIRIPASSPITFELPQDERVSIRRGRGGE
jgi:hypothetical protein